MEENETCNFELTNHQKTSHKTVSWALECIGTLIISPAGIVFNIIALHILLNTKLSEGFFNKLLAILAIFDILYLIVSTSEAIRQYLYHTCLHDYIFVIFTYPIRSIFMSCSIYMTLALAVERFISVCKPISHFVSYRNKQAHNWKRAFKNSVFSEFVEDFLSLLVILFSWKQFSLKYLVRSKTF